MKQSESFENFYHHSVGNNKKLRTCRILICLSGKRKSGKDFIAVKLSEFFYKNLAPKLLVNGNIGLFVSVVGISYLLKNQFAALNNLDAEKLKSDNLYKEIVRKEMVDYGNKIRLKDPSFFCRKALESTFVELNNQQHKSTICHIIIVSDCRRISDLRYFKSLFNFILTTNVNDNCSVDDIIPEEYLPIFIRVETSEEIRRERGYVFTSEIDDAETECALDTFSNWDFKLQNNNDYVKLDYDFQIIYNLCVLKLNKLKVIV